MPFTFSHPAAVLPLTYLPKRWFSLTGLFIGSTIPDFEYFLRMRGLNEYSHTWHGVFWLDLPLGIFVTLVWHEVVRNKLIDHLPVFIKERVYSFKNFDWTYHFKRNSLVVILSLLIGITSHILWDALTHERGIFVQHLQVLRGSIDIAGHVNPIYHILQHVSTIIGLIAIFLAFLQWPKTSGVPYQPIFRYWFLIWLIAITIITTRFVIGKGTYDLGDKICVIISGFMAGVVLVSFLKISNAGNIGLLERQ